MTVGSNMLHAEIHIGFDGTMAAKLRREALLRGVTAEELALHLLRAIVTDGIYDAVLDGPPRAPRVKKQGAK